ncbi:FecR family protein [Aquimarina pacifica]|uniref:FecR family protein n=1 Tax=Aquimarina pacifica TaxID=1296415 RepID=UPI0004708B3B|nr:FecR family protein [Aquimarina pacifica]
MLSNKEDDIFLSRWINEELSEEELSEFKSHPEYEYFTKIKQGTDSLVIREYDIENALSRIKSTRVNNTSKKRSIIKLVPYFAAAASIAIIIGLFLYQMDTSFATNYGKQQIVVLPDGSEMILNAKSEASFNKNEWKEHRTVSLNGEAYFKVKKGSKFTVKTKNGTITVLGTQFNVQSQNKFFEVTCYEGKVRVNNDTIEEVLTKGKGYRNIEKRAPERWSFESQKPSWLTKTSSFKSTPIEYVFKELEEQYQIKIITNNIDLKTIYTGSFPNTNKKVALTTVFSTLGMTYKLSDDSKTVVVE